MLAGYKTKCVPRREYFYIAIKESFGSIEQARQTVSKAYNIRTWTKTDSKSSTGESEGTVQILAKVAVEQGFLINISYDVKPVFQLWSERCRKQLAMASYT